MYHRFNENKYPSTNIRMNIFKEQMEIIKNSNYTFSNPKTFAENFKTPKTNKEILITIDDAFLSFYQEAWPYLKKNKIPFILFVSTEPIGKKGYMTWEQIKEVEAEKFTIIGHHSHSHGYLIDEDNDFFISDIKKADEIFLKNLGYIPNLFSYPFGEYSKFMRDYISKNFDYAFGQHSGVIDLNKDKYELPRFPINEKYGDLERFKFIVELLPLQYKEIYPQEKIIDNNNPPDMKVEFFKDQKINNINCYSNEGNGWDSSKLKIENNILKINFRDKFNTRRGRINCSMKDEIGWRWFGIQFIVKNIKEN